MLRALTRVGRAIKANPFRTVFVGAVVIWTIRNYLYFKSRESLNAIKFDDKATRYFPINEKNWLAMITTPKIDFQELKNHPTERIESTTKFKNDEVNLLANQVFTELKLLIDFQGLRKAVKKYLNCINDI